MGTFRRAAHSICNLSYKVPKKNPEEFKGQFECLGENTEKYITFSVPIKKEVVNGKKKKMMMVKRKKKKKIIVKKKMIIVKERKQSCIKQSLLIAIDLCKANYQT